MKVNWVFFLFLILSPFIMSFSFFKRNYVDVAQDIRDQVGKNLAKKHHMNFIGTSGGMIKCVRLVGFSFENSNRINRDEARYLIVDCVEELLKAFNENEKIRPFLIQFPLTVKNVDVSIYFPNSNREDINYPHTCVASVYQDDVIEYTIMDKTPKVIETTEEPYQEALAKVRGLSHNIERPCRP